MTRTRLQSALAAAFSIATALTAVWPRWIESLGLDPDHGKGTAEWVIVAVLGMLAICTGTLATRNAIRLRVRARLEQAT
jgi:hypothetical protein